MRSRRLGSSRHDDAMGRDPTEQATSDLFSTDQVRGDSPPPAKPGAAEAETETAPQRHILPKSLRHAVMQLTDGELDELFDVTLAEAKRRGRLPRSIGAELMASPRRPSDLMSKRSSIDKRRQADIAEVPLTRDQLNAIRSEFKAGITPSRITRHFGISQSNVRKALASVQENR